MVASDSKNSSRSVSRLHYPSSLFSIVLQHPIWLTAQEEVCPQRSPHDCENAANNRHPADVRLEENHSRNVCPEGTWQGYKKYISDDDIPDQRQSDITSDLHPLWELRTLPQGTETASRCQNGNDMQERN